MKGFIITLLFLSFNAFAQSVGDYSRMSMRGTSNGQNFTGELRQSLIDFNQNSNDYLYRVITTVNGQTQEEENWTSDFFQTQTAQLLLQQCENLGYQIETLSVPAGNIRTCRIQAEAGTTIWVANVPFGLVKSQVDDGSNRVEMILEEFSRGE